MDFDLFCRPRRTQWLYALLLSAPPMLLGSKIVRIGLLHGTTRGMQNILSAFALRCTLHIAPVDGARALQCFPVLPRDRVAQGSSEGCGAGAGGWVGPPPNPNPDRG